MIVSHNITPPVALVRLDDMGKFATNNCPNSTLFVISPSNTTAVKLTRCFNKSALIFSCHHLLIYAFYQLQPASQPASQPGCDVRRAQRHLSGVKDTSATFCPECGRWPGPVSLSGGHHPGPHPPGRGARAVLYYAKNRMRQ